MIPGCSLDDLGLLSQLSTDGPKICSLNRSHIFVFKDAEIVIRTFAGSEIGFTDGRR